VKILGFYFFLFAFLFFSNMASKTTKSTKQTAAVKPAIACILKSQDEAMLRELIEASEIPVWISANSEVMGLKTTISPYTNKKGQTHYAHWTANGKYLQKAKPEEEPMFYQGFFDLRKMHSHFKVSWNPSAKTLQDLFTA
jgi:hypothetical protein